MKKTVARFLAVVFGLWISLLPAAGMLTVSELHGFNVAGGGPASVTFVGCTSDATDGASATFTAHATGTAGNRWTIVGVAMADGATDFSTTGLTVAGNAATEVADSAAVSIVNTSLYIISNPSGTTADIIPTASEVVSNFIICVWAAYDLQSGTAFDFAALFDTASASLDLSCDLPVGGIAVGISNVQAAAQAVTWAGLTEDLETGAVESTEASPATGTTPGTPLTISADWSGTNDATGVSGCFR